MPATAEAGAEHVMDGVDTAAATAAAARSEPPAGQPEDRARWERRERARIRQDQRRMERAQRRQRRQERALQRRADSGGRAAAAESVRTESTPQATTRDPAATGRAASPATPDMSSPVVATSSTATKETRAPAAAGGTRAAPAAVKRGGKRVRWTREAIIDELARWMVTGTAIDSSFVKRHGPPGLVPAAIRIFGRFDAALNVAGLHVAKLYPDGPPAR